MSVKPRVLILACDPAIAALLADHFVAVGAEPCCADADEIAEHALQRERPSIVILDCDHQAARSELFRRHAARAGASIALFSQCRDDRYVAQLADDELIPWFGFPLQRSRLELLLRAAGSGNPTPSFDRLPRFVPEARENRLQA